MKFLTLLFLIFLTISSFANSFTSVMNGDWSNPLTWGETAIIPLTGDEVIINHTVTITDQITVDGYWSTDGENASITIGANGILQTGESVFGIAILNGASITNNGQANFPQLGNYSGVFTNNATCTFSQLIYNLDEFVNNGELLDIDSLYTNGNFTNNIDAKIYTDSLLNDYTGTFINKGKIYLQEFSNNETLDNIGLIEFRRFTNRGKLTNTGSLVGSVDATNSGHLILAAGSSLTLENSFSNTNEIDHTALLEVEGSFIISNSFTNRDTVKGQNGSLELQSSSSNFGWMKGSFVFCDHTPTSGTPVNIDYNTGVIETTVQDCASLSVQTISSLEISFYPNPTNESVKIINASQVKLVDLSGKLVLSKNIENEAELDIHNLKKGIYIITLTNNDKSLVRRLVID